MWVQILLFMNKFLTQIIFKLCSRFEYPKFVIALQTRRGASNSSKYPKSNHNSSLIPLTIIYTLQIQSSNYIWSNYENLDHINVYVIGKEEKKWKMWFIKENWSWLWILTLKHKYSKLHFWVPQFFWRRIVGSYYRCVSFDLVNW